MIIHPTPYLTLLSSAFKHTKKTCVRKGAFGEAAVLEVDDLLGVLSCEGARLRKRRLCVGYALSLLVEEHCRLKYLI